MTEAPERIWAVHWNTEGAVMNGAWADTIRHFGGGVEYLRADHVDALLKAEREKALREAAEVAGEDHAEPGAEGNDEMSDLLEGPKPELMPCPFCGASPHWMLSKVKHDQLHGDPYQYRIIACPKGHAQIRMLSNDAAAKEWNTRK